jgi:hypothetical protein
MADFSVDLRPRLVLHPPGGDPIILIIDPTSPLAGAVEFPILGAVPYTVEVGFPVSHVHLSLPLWGDVSIPVDPLAQGGGSVNIPGLGDVPYEIVLGPPGGVETVSAGSAWLLPLLLIGGVILLMRRR